MFQLCHYLYDTWQAFNPFECGSLVELLGRLSERIHVKCLAPSLGQYIPNTISIIITGYNGENGVKFPFFTVAELILL